MICVIEKAFGRFCYDEQLKCMYHFWKGFLFPDEVQYVAETTNPLMEKLGLFNVIADHRDMEMFSEDVSEYIASTWIPAQERIGVKNIFVVLSSDVFARMAAEDMHQEAENLTRSIRIQHFDNLEKAQEAARQAVLNQDKKFQNA